VAALNQLPREIEGAALDAAAIETG
jgi:hypothetical protein